ncbi:Gfo/Idh/MocA family protein [Pelagicoccus mobilis]|uniref:Gfo/Idh/MocA family oxidoreductase n=1 Tax=Pelagicoccus mobilis TaxID=415221 RepID=A0A934VR87_9BACT|nr:Gfo/Idh/MocA family oxidoreductase [Pelagicoccus mobilis]MBK1877670.1 Gfo/Idh/MocA family oxidoreductase [Pelagicoccus mobilis]
MSVSAPKLGIIGCGDITTGNHLPNALKTNWQIAALCDGNLDAAEDAREASGIPDTPIFEDYKDLLALKDLNAVIIATPPVSHMPITIDALRAGKHVLCEKPSTLSVAENEAILAEAKKYPEITVQFFSSRFRDEFSNYAREIVRSGKLGKIYRTDIQFSLPAARACDLEKVKGKPHRLWFGKKEKAGGGPFMDMGQYFLDRLFHILDWPELESLSAQEFRGMETGLPNEADWDVEDHMTVLARMEGNLTLTMDTTARALQHWRWSININGTSGSLSLDNTRQDKFVYTYEDPVSKELRRETKEAPQSVDDLPARLFDLEAILNGESREIGTTPEQALMLTDFCMKAYQSSKQRAQVSA